MKPQSFQYFLFIFLIIYSVSPIKGSEENESGVAMGADKFEAATSNPTPEALARLERFRLLPKRKGTIKTIEDLDYGDVIDCVDFWQQPSFDDPKILEDDKKHYVTFPPKNVPGFLKEHRANIPKDDRHAKLVQNWHKYGDCPEGTVPILRMPKLYRKIVKKWGSPGLGYHRKE